MKRIACVRCGGDGSRCQVRWPRARKWYSLCSDCWLEWHVLGTLLIGVLHLRYKDFPAEQATA